MPEVSQLGLELKENQVIVKTSRITDTVRSKTVHNWLITEGFQEGIEMSMHNMDAIPSEVFLSSKTISTTLSISLREKRTIYPSWKNHRKGKKLQ
ncbi:hypothetical protein [Rhodonellum sp.]|uniref:hypothetical protein n=1 Tax=Rhodonellum sp. TaxID=2231180 RepID=UPI002722031B|nr:hypothetical protein [Rhodonellum sp.]MDO9553134.1 hypothetical protein [Rhodonellum sp.]